MVNQLKLPATHQFCWESLNDANTSSCFPQVVFVFVIVIIIVIIHFYLLSQQLLKYKFNTLIQLTPKNFITEYCSSD